MCQHNTRTKQRSLEAIVLATLVRHGVHVDQAHEVAKAVLTDVANSEISHPCWAAAHLGRDDEQDIGNDKADLTDGEGETEVQHIASFELGKDGLKQIGGDATELPPHVLAMIENIKSNLLSGRRPID